MFGLASIQPLNAGYNAHEMHELHRVRVKEKTSEERNKEILEAYNRFITKFKSKLWAYSNGHRQYGFLNRILFREVELTRQRREIIANRMYDYFGPLRSYEGALVRFAFLDVKQKMIRYGKQNMRLSTDFNVAADSGELHRLINSGIQKVMRLNHHYFGALEESDLVREE